MKRSAEDPPARPQKRTMVGRLVDAKQDAEIKKLKYKVNRLRGNEELNNKDVSTTFEISYDTNQATHLSSIPVGTGEGTRQGRHINPRSIEIRGNIICPVTAAYIESMPVRVILIQSKQRFAPNTTSVGGISGVLSSANSQYGPFGFFDIGNRRHFTVLHDQTIAIGQANYDGGFVYDGQGSFHIKKRITRRIAWEDDTTVNEQGHLYLLFYGAAAAALNSGPIVRFASRLLYTDSG